MEPLGQRRGVYRSLVYCQTFSPKVKPIYTRPAVGGAHLTSLSTMLGSCVTSEIPQAPPDKNPKSWQLHTQKRAPVCFELYLQWLEGCVLWASWRLWVLVVCLVLGQFSSKLLYFEGLEPFPRLVAFYSFVVLFDTQSINRQINFFSFSRIVFFYACRALLHSKSYSLAFSF